MQPFIELKKKCCGIVIGAPSSGKSSFINSCYRACFPPKGNVTPTEWKIAASWNSLTGKAITREVQYVEFGDLNFSLIDTPPLNVNLSWRNINEMLGGNLDPTVRANSKENVVVLITISTDQLSNSKITAFLSGIVIPHLNKNYIPFFVLLTRVDTLHHAEDISAAVKRCSNLLNSAVMPFRNYVLEGRNVDILDNVIKETLLHIFSEL